MLITLSILSCNLFNFDELIIEMYPSSHNEIIPVDSKLTISFSLPPEKQNAEAMFKFTDLHGSPVNGYSEWLLDGTKTIFQYTPISPLQEGMKYKISYTGTVVIDDGRTFTVRNERFFYGGSKNAIPILIESSPPPMSIVPVNEPLILTFSTPIDTLVFEKEFSVSPAAKLLFEWNADNTEVSITPEIQWQNKNMHTWIVSTNIKSAEGVHLVQRYTGQFLVQEDIIPPELSSISICFYNSTLNSFTNLPGLDVLTELNNDRHLQIEFSEPVEFNTIQCKFTPEIDGYLIEQSPTVYIFKRTGNFTPGEEYLFEIKKGIRDKAGNVSLKDYEYAIHTQVPKQEINSIQLISDSDVSDTIMKTNFNTENITRFPGTNYIYDDTAKSIIFKIDLGYPITKYTSRIRFIESIKINKIFPIDGSSSDPYIAEVVWNTGTSVTLHIYDFEYSDPTYDYDYLYTFTINSHPDALADNGSYLLDDITLYFASLKTP